MKIYLALSVCCVSMLCATALGQSVSDVEESVREAWDEHDALAADIVMRAELPVGENRVTLEGKGESAYLKDGERSLYKQEMTLQMPPPLSMEVRNEIVFDGEFIYLTNEAMGRSETLQDRPSIENGNVPPGGGLLFDVLKEYMDLKVLEEGDVDGRPVYRIEGVPKAAVRDRAGFIKAEFAIDKATGFLMRSELFESERTAAAVIEASNLNTSPTLKPEDFAPPEGYGEDLQPGEQESDEP